jgi:hypothetical protein
MANHRPAYRPLGGWPPLGRIWWFQLLLISNNVFWASAPDHGIHLKSFSQVLDMKMSEFLSDYNGDIATYQRQFVTADDSVDDILDLASADLKPHRAGGSSGKDSDEENESADTLSSLPQTLASNRVMASKFQTPGSSTLHSNPTFFTPAAGPNRVPLVSYTPSNTRPPRRSELENPQHSRLVLFQESKKGSPLAQEISELGTPELKRVQAQIDKMMKEKQPKP